MERLRQEVLLLHGRVESQQEVINTLQTELRESLTSRHTLEREFEHYRIKMKERMISLLEGKAKVWLEEMERRQTDTHSTNGVCTESDSDTTSDTLTQN